MKNKIVMLCLVCFIICSHIWKDNSKSIKGLFKKNLFANMQYSKIVTTTGPQNFSLLKLLR